MKQKTNRYLMNTSNISTIKKCMLITWQKYSITSSKKKRAESNDWIRKLFHLCLEFCAAVRAKYVSQLKLLRTQLQPLERHLVLWSCASVLLWDPRVLTNFRVGRHIVNASAFLCGALRLSCSVCNSGAEGSAGLTAHSQLFGQSGVRPHTFHWLRRAHCSFGESGQSECGNERENKNSLTR